MDKKLDRLEQHLQTIIEEKLVRIITGHQPSETLIERLVKVLRESLIQDPTGSTIAPDQIIIHVNPENLLDWRAHQEDLDQISKHLQAEGTGEGLNFFSDPQIIIQSDPQIAWQEYAITTTFSDNEDPLPDTSAMTPAHVNRLEESIPAEACLIVRGEKNITLDKVVINIGRHSDNDLVLQDPHVSRQHAQLRVIKDHYVIFDAGSTGGVFLNGKKIAQATLQSGDVIRIGMTNLIYVQEPSAEGSTTVLPADNEGSEE